MMLESKYSLGDTVYVKMDSDQKPRMVIGITFLPGGAIQYSLSPYGTVWEMEITEDKDVLTTTTN